jgi:hypothetical protein
MGAPGAKRRAAAAAAKNDLRMNLFLQEAFRSLSDFAGFEQWQQTKLGRLRPKAVDYRWR